MKRKIFSVLLTLVLVLSFSLVTAVPIGAATITVDDSGGADHLTIQAAIDAAATTGDTISVADGTYTEQLTITNKGVTITGESETGVIVQAAATQTGTANVFTIDADGYDITIQYMTIRYGDYGIRSSAGNVNVLHTTLYHNGWDGTGLPDPDTDPQGDFVTFYSTYATSGGAIRIQNSSSSEIAYNTVYENDRGIRFQDSSNGDIHDNVSHDNIQAGIYLAASSYDGTTGSSDTNVYDNESYGNMNNGLLSIGGINNTFSNNNVHDNWNSGVMLWSVADNTIQNNTIDHNNLYAFNGQGNNGDALGGVWAQGIDIDGSATFVFKLLNNTISNNEQGRAGQKIGLRLGNNLPVYGIEVRGNTFINHDLDIHVRSQADTTVVNYNSFDGTGTYGILNEDTANLDATNNWWGHASGPSGLDGRINKKGKFIGKGDAISGNVNWDPWLPQPIGHTKHDPVPPGLR